MSRSQDPGLTLDERLKILYPSVDETETPLPRSWSSKDKYDYIGLSLNNLRVQYKGHGKTHKDASSVRATHPIPTSCGIYYFEVKIVSKGRDGYMGVGLSAQGVNMNRLPGWDKHSYGYHGDDGHSFCSSGTGQAYGPTFTTGEVIGCGINLVESTCFYTKNGHNLGVAFKDLPPNLYPTVGLQTPGEIVDANFGQEPFLFDIEGEMMEQRIKILGHIEDLPTPGRHGDWQCKLHRLVSGYLVHHGFSATAASFNEHTHQPLNEELSSIRNRQEIRRLVLNGKTGEAIHLTEKLYPDLFPKNPNLLFLLKVRQFIEMVSGSESLDAVRLDSDMDVSATNGKSAADATNGNCLTSDHRENNDNNPHNPHHDDSMDVDLASSASNSGTRPPPLTRNWDLNFAKLIQFGQSLHTMLLGLEKTPGLVSDQDLASQEKMLQDAFSLLAYSDPFNSPVGWQLDPQEREVVCDELNSAILRLRNLPGRPLLEQSIEQAKDFLKLMSKHDLGACAFANVDDFLR
ncbi:hypothetical protein TCAL_01336 [Tigriopus californicus]|uniref:B30.2/SPRY domain-containing protein n=1 Tax=Tigriopus californicus TaxID=6832 RepID=A0A553PC90_TIGCA|nr:ran-binding protein 10-like [Tigriopus californicus]TRY75293.1 hypothetical protein TCAL_01336 [Tigriopus californicus]|eukprot:TCALIF_01336-PA protein Name:"Similar to ranbp9 Ran-binding protein 9 (Xenopus tropicalis)" AED:0.05 eAED:0.05 QI:0/-1/0/1/-1/1/1/0/515